MNLLILIGVIAGGFLLFVIFFLAFMSKFLIMVEPGKALIITSAFGKKGPKVTFTGSMIFPIIHKAEIMDISTKVMTVTRNGTDGLICKDNIRADLTVHFYLRVNMNEDDVRQVATSIGCKRSSTPETLNELFQAKFSEALKTVGKQMDFEELFQERTKFKEEIIKSIGRDLNGYKLEDTAIDYLSQTPMEHLDPNDIMDSQGIKKITELTAIQSIQTNEITKQKEETITKRNVEATERILELEKQRAEAEAKQLAEIEIIKAKEESEKQIVIQQERLKSESAKINSDEQLSISEQNKDREIEIAMKNKERAIIIETEKIEKEKQLEITEREKIVSLATYEKDRVLEEEKKKIQDIIRQRVVLERAVAEEEEKTKDIRIFAEADRNKKVTLTMAEEEAQKNLIIDIKSAEAKEIAATHIAKEREIMAEVEKTTALRIAESKEILANGIIAEQSATGLAEAKVEEAMANVILKKGKSEADAKKQMGEANAFATLQMGEAEAKSLTLKNEAEALSLRLKYEAEANGIKEKAESMKLLDAVGRDHEEFKLKLSMEEKLSIEEIKIKKDIAMAQAQVLAEALKSANIQIVGGESQFFEKLSNSIISGKTNSAMIENNNILKEFKDALLKTGDENVVVKIKNIIDKLGISSNTIKNLSIASLLHKLSGNAKDDNLLKQINNIKEMVNKLGIGDMILNLTNNEEK
ncbi:MAG: hypothetical protein A2086_02370 [Spirochaetes bacterium GWD1_27_9]|nr:MAG: hypothetical protein A2Z98_08235 [Spirochaetes bacterium GWB1_27_13]OHD27758.1 MAG: hypothetical protein A2Y34_08965 [Spirochaetes bacterium GWC1_27_15]OHD31575.1 MAG: hypothetical protein A2086_02370 [Spirochaetes bacterium GWD1_27_9]